jgi:hypothetical protein
LHAYAYSVDKFFSWWHLLYGKDWTAKRLYIISCHMSTMKKNPFFIFLSTFENGLFVTFPQFECGKGDKGKTPSGEMGISSKRT